MRLRLRFGLAAEAAQWFAGAGLGGAAEVEFDGAHRADFPLFAASAQVVVLFLHGLSFRLPESVGVLVAAAFGVAAAFAEFV